MCRGSWQECRRGGSVQSLFSTGNGRSAAERSQARSNFVAYAVVWPEIAWLALKCSLSGQISFMLLLVYPELDTDATR